MREKTGRPFFYALSHCKHVFSYAVMKYNAYIAPLCAEVCCSGLQISWGTRNLITVKR